MSARRTRHRQIRQDSRGYEAAFEERTLQPPSFRRANCRPWRHRLKPAGHGARFEPDRRNPPAQARAEHAPKPAEAFKILKTKVAVSIDIVASRRLRPLPCTADARVDRGIEDTKIVTGGQFFQPIAFQYSFK